MISWCHFKPECTGKPEEDADAHLLHTNDWMRTHNFNEDDKVQRFSLTLLGEARLWYETLTPVANDWPALQNALQTTILKIGQHSKAILSQLEKFLF